MDSADLARAVPATLGAAREAGLDASQAVVLHNSTKVALRLLPCEAFARVAYEGGEVARLEIEVARQLARVGSPAAALDARVEPRPHARDGFVITFWRFYEVAAGRPLGAHAYALALERLHAGMRVCDVSAPHFTNRVAEARHLLTTGRDGLVGEADRTLLLTTMEAQLHKVLEASSTEQLLHGEPHPGNVLDSVDGPVFVDFETCCRGPIEFDLAHAPVEVAARYRHADATLVPECRGLVLAMVAAWRLDPDDQFPGREKALSELLDAVRGGPPWPSLDALGR